MTDEQRIATIKKIYSILWHPETGFKAFWKQPENRNLSREELDERERQKVAEIAAGYGLGDAYYYDQLFSIRGQDVMKHRFYGSCGNAAKAFCYINSTLPADEQLEVKIMITTRTDHLIDSQINHTLPVIKMADGKWHALDPQIPIDKKNPNVPFLSGEMEPGRIIQHIIPSSTIQGYDFKIMRIIDWQEYEDKLSRFHKFIETGIERSPEVTAICNTIEQQMQALDLEQYPSTKSQVYVLCNALAGKNIEMKVLMQRNKAEHAFAIPAVKLDGDWYKFNPADKFLRFIKLENFYDNKDLLYSVSAPQYIEQCNIFISNENKEILDTIESILQTLHHPETGFNGFRNEVMSRKQVELDALKGQKLSKEERAAKVAELDDKYMEMGYTKVAEMATALNPDMKDASFDEQKFSLTGKSIMENRLYVSCGNAAKAFCYVNSLLPKEKQLDIQIMLGTDINNLIDGKSGHTLPLVKFPNGQYYAIEPQIKPSKNRPTFALIPYPIQQGIQVEHVLNGIARHERKHKVMKIVSPEYLETDLLKFENFLRITVERSPETTKICNKIESILKQLKLKQYKKDGSDRMTYEFLKNCPDATLPLDVLEYQGDKGTTAYLRVMLDGNWYSIKLDSDYLNIQHYDTPTDEMRQKKNLPPFSIFTPSEYIKVYKKRLDTKQMRDKADKIGQLITERTEQPTILPGQHEYE